MKVAVRKWGNSLAVRIPRAFAEDVRLTEGAQVDVTVDKGRLVLVPQRPERTLTELLDQVTDDNRHVEIETGTPVGREVW